MLRELERSSPRHNRAGQQQFSLEPRPVGLQRGARRVAEPEPESFEIVSWTILKPSVDGVPKLIHARQYRPTSRATDAHFGCRASFRQTNRAGRRNLVDAVLGCRGEPVQ